MESEIVVKSFVTDWVVVVKTVVDDSIIELLKFEIEEFVVNISFVSNKTVVVVFSKDIVVSGALVDKFELIVIKEMFVVDASDVDGIVPVDGTVVTINVVEKSVVKVVKFVKFAESIDVVGIVIKGVVVVKINVVNKLLVVEADVEDGISVSVVSEVLFAYVTVVGTVTEEIVLVKAIDVVEAISLEFLVVDVSVVNWIVVELIDCKFIVVESSVVEREVVEFTSVGRLDVELIRVEDKTVVGSIEVEFSVIVEADDEEV